MSVSEYEREEFKLAFLGNKYSLVQQQLTLGFSHLAALGFKISLIYDRL